MTTVLHAADAAGLLSLVPVLAGFTPRNSLVLLPFHGSRSHGAMRLDLPGEEVDPVGYAGEALDLVARIPGTEAVTVVVYTDDRPESAEAPLPHRDLVARLGRAATRRGLATVDALCVTPAGWASYLADPTRLHPLEDLPPAPDLPGIGDVSGDQAADAVLPKADPGERERVARALAAMERAPGAAFGIAGTGRPAMPFTAAEDIPDFLESLIEAPENPSPADTAALLWCLERPALRDVALLHWALGPDQGRQALASATDLGAVDIPAIDGASALLLGLGPRPDGDRLRLALSVLRTTAARAPEPARGGALALAAWVSWALGRTTPAVHYLDLILREQPEHRLAGILRQLIDAAVLPEWLFDVNGSARRPGARVPRRRTGAPAPATGARPAARQPRRRR